MCHLCEQEERMGVHITDAIEKAVDAEQAAGNKVTPFFILQTVLNTAMETLAIIAMEHDEREPGFKDKAQEEAALITEKIMDFAQEIGKTHPGGIMQGNMIMGIVGAAYIMTSNANKKSELDKMVNSANPLAALLNAIGLSPDELLKGAPGVSPVQESISTKEINNVKDKPDFSNLTEAIGESKE